MASTGKITGKRMLIPRSRLTSFLTSSGKNPNSNVRRSPRLKQANLATSSDLGTTFGGSSVRRSLFSGSEKPTSYQPQPMSRSDPRQSHSSHNRASEEAPSMSRSNLRQSHSSHNRASEETPSRESNAPLHEDPQCHIERCSSGVRSSPRHIRQSHRLDSLERNLEANHEISSSENEGIYNSTSRRRVQATKQKNEKGRGCNKTKVLKDAIYVDVNDELQPINNSARQLSSLIGCLARDPRRLPLDCFDWRKIEQEKKDALWQEVKRSFNFPERREPYDWVLQKMHACWRGYKSELKVAHFDGRTHDEAIGRRPEHIPLEKWENLVKFWESCKGQERSKRGIENQANSKLPHYAGTKGFARIRAEEEGKGNKLDRLQMWFKTHEPNKGSKLDDASAATKDTIESELSQFEDDTCDPTTRDDIFKKVVGEDKNGYAKTFGMGIKVPRSRTKRCALEEERAKRFKIEQEHRETKEKVQKLDKMMLILLKHQGLSEHVISSLENEVASNENENDNLFVEDDLKMKVHAITVQKMKNEMKNKIFSF